MFKATLDAKLFADYFGRALRSVSMTCSQRIFNGRVGLIGGFV